MSEDAVIDVKAEDFIIPDRGTFLETLDFSRPGLGPVREALDRGDIEAAGRAFMRHFRARDMTSPLLVDWSRIPRDPSRVTKATEGILDGHLQDGYNVYEVPPTGIDWHEAPLACLTRFGIFPPLIEAAWHTGDARYVRYVVDHSLEYIRAWPIESFVGQDTRKGWRNHYVVSPPWWWCMHPNRLHLWALAMAFLRLSPQVTDEELLTILHRMLQEIRFHTFFFDRHVNCGENVGAFILEVMATLCVVMADFRESRRWMDMTAGGVVRFMTQSFYPDGLYKELVTAYSASVSLEVQKPAFLILDHPTMQPLKDRLCAMLIAIVAQSKPDGILPPFGDLFAHAAKSYIMEPLPDALGISWLKPFLDKQGPVPPFLHWPERAQDAWGGYYSMRSDWTPNALFLLIDAGPWGAAHQHCDKLSFVLSAHGADFLADPSTTTYASNEPGAFITMLNAGFLHNTITVDDVDEYIQPPGYWTTDKPLANRWENRKDVVLFEGDFDFAPLKAVRWVRRLVFVKNAYWILQDVLTGEPDA
ncbi:MAG: alginate lyase family protein, partial [Lentisphaerae bacterium]|nr:alginate lyase family protein [Lentisphaerota bacterium]